jgi:hypothetical protein
MEALRDVLERLFFLPLADSSRKTSKKIKQPLSKVKNFILFLGPV